MKTVTKRLMALAALISLQAPLFAHKFTFVNNTGKALEFEVNASGQVEMAVIAQGKSHTFDYDKMGGWDNILFWMGDLCLTSAHAKPAGSLLGKKQVEFDERNFCYNSTFILTEPNGNIIARRIIIN